MPHPDLQGNPIRHGRPSPRTGSTGVGSGSGVVDAIITGTGFSTMIF